MCFRELTIFRCCPKIKHHENEFVEFVRKHVARPPGGGRGAPLTTLHPLLTRSPPRLRERCLLRQERQKVAQDQFTGPVQESEPSSARRLGVGREDVLGRLRPTQLFPQLAHLRRGESRLVIIGHHWSSSVIIGHQRSSVAIRGHQRSSEVIRGHHAVRSVRLP